MLFVPPQHQSAGSFLPTSPSARGPVLQLRRCHAFLKRQRESVEHILGKTERAHTGMRKRHIDGRVIATRARASVGDEGNQLRQPRAHLVWLVDAQQHVLRVRQVRIPAQHHALDVGGFERVTRSVDVLVPGLERSESTQPQARRIVGFRKVDETAPNVVVVVDVRNRQRWIGADTRRARPTCACAPTT